MLSERVLVSATLVYASGSADRNSSIIDMKGYDGCLFVVTLAAIAAGGTNSVKLQQGAASDMADAADLAGTGVTIADNDDDELVLLDCWQPRERYIRLVVDKDTVNSMAESVLAIRYRGKDLPTTQGSSVTLEKHASVAEGTA